MPKNYHFHLLKFFIISSLNLIVLSNKIYSQSLTAEQIYEKVNNAVVVILAYDNNNELASQGSGVVINDKGYVVTNYHVLSGNERLEIMHDKEIVPFVDIIGIDVEMDILILKIEEKKFPPVKIGNVKALKVGQRVYAIGSPMGFENTISEGIISGLRRYDEERKNYIQITASISPGSSGGAIVNNRGELIGISTLTINDGQNLNFAIPINEALSVEISSYNKNDSFKDFEYFSKGVTAIRNGDYKDAVVFFTSFIEKYPDNSNAFLNRGYAKSELEDNYGAINDYTMAIELNPNDAVAYSNRAVEKNKLGDYYGALQDNNLAIKIDPEDAVSFHNRGRDKYYLNDYIGAIVDFSKAIDLNPEYGGAYYNRALTKHRMNDISGACLDLSKAGELGYYEAYNVMKEICN